MAARRRPGRGRLAAFALLIGASVLLGASFLALGYLVSAAVRERATAAGIAVGVWLFFVVIYDMALLGALAADQGRHIGPARSTRCCCSTPRTCTGC